MGSKRVSKDMKARVKPTETLNERGNLAAEPGSRDWAIAMRLEILSLLADNESSAKHLRMTVLDMQERHGYKHLFRENGKPFLTFEEFCVERQPFGLGYESRVIQHIIEEREDIQARAQRAEPLLDDGGDRRSPRFQIDNVKLKGGNSSEYLLRKLAREAKGDPVAAAVLDRVKRGEYKSVRAAAIDAGIVKPDTPLVLLKRAWARASQREQKEFIEWTGREIAA